MLFRDSVILLGYGWMQCDMIGYGLDIVGWRYKAMRMDAHGLFALWLDVLWIILVLIVWLRYDFRPDSASNCFGDIIIDSITKWLYWADTAL